ALAGTPFDGTVDLVVETRLDLNGSSQDGARALVLKELEHVSWAAAHVPKLAPRVRALISPEVPSSLVPRLSGAGVLALACSTEPLRQLLEAKTLRLPKLSAEHSSIEVAVGKQQLTLAWLAPEEERRWVINGSVTTPAATKQK